MKKQYWDNPLKLLLVGIVLAFAGCATTISSQDLSREYYNIGNAFFQLKKYPEASLYFKRALELDASMTQAEFNLARTFIETGEYDLAVMSLEKLRGLDPANLLILKTLAYVYYYQGKGLPALEMYRLVLKETPLDKDVLFNAGMIAKELELKAEALEHLSAFKKEGGIHKDLLINLVALQKTDGNVDDEKKLLEELLVADPQNADGHKRLGEILEHQELFLDAVKSFEKALTILEGKNTPDADLSWRVASLYLVRIQDVDAALPLFEKAFAQGFKDTKKVSDLLALSGLPQKERLEKFFEEKRSKESPSAR